jgi:hypothetical protein
MTMLNRCTNPEGESAMAYHVRFFRHELPGQMVVEAKEAKVIRSACGLVA